MPGLAWLENEMHTPLILADEPGWTRSGCASFRNEGSKTAFQIASGLHAEAYTLDAQAARKRAEAYAAGGYECEAAEYLKMAAHFDSMAAARRADA